MIINISQEAHETSSVLSIYHKIGIFHHGLVYWKESFRKSRRMRWTGNVARIGRKHFIQNSGGET